MANLPATTDESSRFRDGLIEALATGHHPNEIAKVLAKGDKKKRKQLRNRIRAMIRDDPRIRYELAGRANVALLLGLIPASEALVRRASRGRPDAIKLLFEASGFYNPKVKHEHSGDIKITLDLPRPPRRVDADIQDADVIED